MNLPFLISRGGRLRAHFPSVRDSHPLRLASLDDGARADPIILGPHKYYI